MGLVSSLGRSCGSCRAARAGSASWRLSRTCQAPWPSHGRQGTDSRRRRRRRRRRRPGAPRPPPRLPGRRRRTGEEGGLRGGEGADWRGDAREGRGRKREALVWERQGAWRRGGATQSKGGGAWGGQWPQGCEERQDPCGRAWNHGGHAPEHSRWPRGPAWGEGEETRSHARRRRRDFRGERVRSGGRVRRVAGPGPADPQRTTPQPLPLPASSSSSAPSHPLRAISGRNEAGCVCWGSAWRSRRRR